MSEEKDDGGRGLIAFLLFVTPIALVASLISAWPIFVQDGKTTLRESWLFSHLLGTDYDVRLLVIVVLSGAIGSCLGAAQAFAAFVGSGRFDPKWTSWYFLRLPIGAGLGLLVYLIIRGGFLTGVSTGADAAKSVNVFGVAAIAMLAGMYAREIQGRLLGILQNALGGDNDADDATPPNVEPVPTISKALTDLKITIKGSNFKKGLKATFDAAPRTIQPAADGTTAVLTLDKLDLAKDEGTLELSNPGSKPKPTKLRFANPPKLTDASAAADPAGGWIIKLKGSNFASTDKVMVGGVTLDPKQPVSATECTVSLGATQGTAGSVKVKVKSAAELLSEERDMTLPA